MNLPKPRVIPLTNTYTAETKDSVSVVWSTSYTASAMYEQFNLSTKILESIDLLNTNFSKMLAMLVAERIKDDQKREEDDSERRPDENSPRINPKMENTDITAIFGGLKTLLLGSIALLSTSLITMLDETRERFIKNIIATTLAITAFSKDLATDTVKLFKGIIKIIPNLIETTTSLIKAVATEGMGIIKGSISYLSKTFGSFKSIIDAIRVALIDTEMFLKDLKIVKWLGTIGTKFEAIFAPIRMIGSWISEIAFKMGKIVGTIAESGLLKTLKVFEPVVSGFLKKLLWPVQLIMSIADFVNGFMQGYAEEGVMEGIKQGLMKVFDGFFGGLKDLSKMLIAGSLRMVGLNKTAEGFNKDIDIVWEDVKKAVGSLLDIFKGIATLDAKTLWKGITGLTGSITDFFVHSISSFFNTIVNIASDLTGVDINAKIQKIFDWFGENVVKEIKGLFEMVYSKLIDSIRWIVENSLPYGEQLANKLFGPKTTSEEQISTEADRIAADKAFSRLDGVIAKMSSVLAEWGISPSGDKNALKYDVTEEDRNAAKQNFANKGNIVPGFIPEVNKPDESYSINAFLGAIGRMASEKDSKPKNNINIQNNMNNSGKSSSPTVVMVPTSDKASHASPVSGYRYRTK